MSRLLKQFGGLSLVLILTLLPACGGKGKSEAGPAQDTAPAAPPAETWISYTPPEGGFEVLAPKAFTRTEDKTPTEAGEIAYVNLMAQDGTHLLYSLVYSDMPETLVASGDPQKLLQGARDGVARQFRGYVEKEAAITLGEYPGLEIRIQGTSEKINLDIRSRFYLVKNRLYQLNIIVQRGYEGLADAGKYFGSFKLK